MITIRGEDITYDYDGNTVYATHLPTGAVMFANETNDPAVNARIAFNKFRLVAEIVNGAEDVGSWSDEEVAELAHPEP